MAELVLGPMLRHVSDVSATIWVETTHRCTVEILGRSTPTFCVAGHHYALAIIEDLQPASSIQYDVRLDGEVRWPALDSTLPPSRIQTLGGFERPSRIVFGSCRTAAPHEPPWSLELALDSRGRGVDALYIYALSMLERPETEWPELAVFLGDQIYADDSSPKARERIAEVRKDLQHDPEKDLPPELVGGFEEYTWLYHEAWSPQIERWFFSNVPTVMIFDDHEMIDDWNISDAWVRTIRTKDWWEDHVIGGLMTYWLYQHLGNLSPADVRAEGLLEALGQTADGEGRLREWAMGAEEFTPTEGNYRFSVVRDIGRVRLVVIDSRNARALEPRNRRMVNEDEWGWVVEACSVDVDHLLIGTSLPVFVPGGLHDLQEWSEAICDGAWGAPGRKFGEWLRVKADMEDWPAFNRSFGAFVQLLHDLGARSRADAPATISVLAGDIHFSFAAEIRFSDQHEVASRVHQLVSSPIRNALRPPESTAMRLGASRFAKVIARGLRRAAGRRRPTVSWAMDIGPVFDNSLGQVYFDERTARLTVLQARPHEDAVKPGFDTVIDFDLVAGSYGRRGKPDVATDLGATAPRAAGE
ncbi:MAG: alkaline phosphatase D family protein [Ilumatobacteraceae bacterium]